MTTDVEKPEEEKDLWQELKGMKDSEDTGEPEPKEEPGEEQPTEEETESAPTEEAQEEPTGEPTEEIPAEPDPNDKEGHRERSKLGREVKELKDQIARLTAQLEGKTKPAPVPAVEEEEEDLGLDEFATVGKVIEVLQKKQEKNQAKLAAYEDGVANGLVDLAVEADLPDDMVDAVAQEIQVLKEKEPKTWNHEVDARIIFNKAYAAAARKKLSAKPEKVNPIPGGESRGPTGTIPKPKTETAPKKVVTLDKKERELANSFGVTDEDLNKMFARR